MLASTPVFTFAPTPVFSFAPSTTKKSLDDASWTEAAVIHSKVKVENNVSTLPRKFRVPPAADLVTPRSVDQSKVRAAVLDDSVMVVDLCESSDEAETQPVKTACVVSKKDAALISSLEKRFLTDNQATPVVNKASKSVKATKVSSTIKSARSKAKMKLDDDSEPENVMPKMCPTLSSTRKRRPAIDYDHVFEDPILDRSDEDDDDFQCEEVDVDDERLDMSFEKSYPDLETPSKRQKRAKR
jgi:hypothetical protein